MNVKWKNFFYSSSVNSWLFGLKVIDFILAGSRKLLLKLLSKIDSERYTADFTVPVEAPVKTPKPKKVRLIDIDIVMSVGLFLRMTNDHCLPAHKLYNIKYELSNSPRLYTPEDINKTSMDTTMQSISSYVSTMSDVAKNDVIYNNQQYYIDLVTNLTSPIVLSFRELLEEEYIKFTTILKTMNHWDANRLVTSLEPNIKGFSKKAKNQHAKLNKQLYDANMKNIFNELEKI